jgi:hypothetical protein
VPEWKKPLDLEDHRVRRVFAQELVIELRRVGAANIDEMCDANVSLLRIPAEEGELQQVSEAARRLGWIELRDRPTEEGQKEWSVSSLGLAVPRPPSLDVGQVVSRVLRFADPIRTGVTDWLPIVAIVAGAISAQQAESFGNEAALDAIRIASIAVLLATLVWGAIGEVYLVKAMHAFSRVKDSPFYAPARRFHSWPRLMSVAVIDILILVAFGMAVFLVWPGVLVSVIPLAIVIAANLWFWRIPAYAIWRKRPPGGIATPQRSSTTEVS